MRKGRKPKKYIKIFMECGTTNELNAGTKLQQAKTRRNRPVTLIHLLRENSYKHRLKIQNTWIKNEIMVKKMKFSLKILI